MRNTARFQHDADMACSDADRIRGLILQLNLLHAQALAIRTSLHVDGANKAHDGLDGAMGSMNDAISDLEFAIEEVECEAGALQQAAE